MAPGTTAQALRPEIVLRQAIHKEDAPRGQVAWGELGVRAPADVLALLPPQVPFVTSGSTGSPVTWWRTREQLVAEASHLVEGLRAARADAIVTHAPTQHLYGFLFGCLVPTLLGLSVHYLPLIERLPRAPRRPLLVALPASWWHLQRAATELERYETLLVVHSTARLPATADEVRRSVPRLELHELHGSTETGLVATRTDARRDWRLAPDVDFAPVMVPGREMALSVRSPRLARPSSGPPLREHTLDDLVTVTGQRSYRLTGRRSRLVKINGRRVDLDHVEGRLRGTEPGIDLACVLVRDKVRGEWYDLLVVGGERERQAVWLACTRALRSWEAPRDVRAVASIERTATGKLRSL